MSEQFKYSYGQAVQVVPSAPLSLRPSAYGSVVGMERVETLVRASSSGYPIGSILYTVEYIDGTDQDIPEEFLIPDPEGDVVL